MFDNYFEKLVADDHRRTTAECWIEHERQLQAAAQTPAPARGPRLLLGRSLLWASSKLLKREEIFQLLSQRQTRELNS